MHTHYKYGFPIYLGKSLQIPNNYNLLISIHGQGHVRDHYKLPHNYMQSWTLLLPALWGSCAPGIIYILSFRTLMPNVVPDLCPPLFFTEESGDQTM